MVILITDVGVLYPEKQCVPVYNNKPFTFWNCYCSLKDMRVLEGRKHFGSSRAVKN